MAHNQFSELLLGGRCPLANNFIITNVPGGKEETARTTTVHTGQTGKLTQASRAGSL